MIVIKSRQDLAHIIENRRYKMGITQQDLAKRSGVTQPMLSYHKKGPQPNSRLDKLLSILDVLDLQLIVMPKV